MVKYDNEMPPLASRLRAAQDTLIENAESTETVGVPTLLGTPDFVVAAVALLQLPAPLAFDA